LLPLREALRAGFKTPGADRARAVVEQLFETCLSRRRDLKNNEIVIAFFRAFEIF
jgi:hypothetical protein